MNSIERVERDAEFDLAMEDAERLALLVNVFADTLLIQDEQLRRNLITLYASALFDGEDS